MSATYLMRWEGAPAYRWVKMHNGKRFRVSCDDLGVPKNKESSYLAANEWWRKKLSELGPKNKKEWLPRPDQEDAVEETKERIRWSVSHQPSLTPRLKNDLEQMRNSADPPILDSDVIFAKRHVLENAGVIFPEHLDPTTLEEILGSGDVWRARYQLTKSNPKHTVESFLTSYLGVLESNCKPASFYEISNYFKRLLSDGSVLLPASDPSLINENTVTEHYKWLISHQYNPATHNKFLGFFRRFVHELYQDNLIEVMPRNIRKKLHRKKMEKKQLPILDLHLVRLSHLPDKYKLWVLLGLNCGMTSVDLGSAHWDQIDTGAWTLTRKRVKTEDNDKTPIVTYKLWPETIHFLRIIPKQHGLLFTSSNNKPLYKCWIDNGKIKKRDLFSSYWRRLKGIPKCLTMKSFRQIGATAFKANPVYRDYIGYYLGHAPMSIRDIHYSAEHDNPFFVALMFIRSHLRIETIFPIP
jgi:integrase